MGVTRLTNSGEGHRGSTQTLNSTGTSPGKEEQGLLKRGWFYRSQRQAALGIISAQLPRASGLVCVCPHACYLREKEMCKTIGAASAFHLLWYLVRWGMYVAV